MGDEQLVHGLGVAVEAVEVGVEVAAVCVRELVATLQLFDLAVALLG